MFRAVPYQLLNNLVTRLVPIATLATCCTAGPPIAGPMQCINMLRHVWSMYCPSKFVCAPRYCRSPDLQNLWQILHEFIQDTLIKDKVSLLYTVRYVQNYAKQKQNPRAVCWSGRVVLPLFLVRPLFLLSSSSSLCAVGRELIGFFFPTNNGITRGHTIGGDTTGS